ncbi:MAG: hypothetical protein Q7I94_05410 [Candidatus Contubernalis sp.]|nr:hypothetical protein [Candidatus Contubernalis sp.]
MRDVDATDNFDLGIDALAAPPTPDGDDVHFLSISGELTPKDKLLKDYRATSDSLTTWKLVLKVANTNTMIVSWNTANLPAGKTCTWQEADSSWNGTGPVYNLTDSPAQISFANTTGDLVTKRYLVKAVLAASTGSISGTVSYSGATTGTVYIGLFTQPQYSSVTPTYWTTILSPGSYSITDISSGEYYVGAFRDTNGNGTLNEASEPFGAYTDNPIGISGGENITAVDIVLTDPSSDGGGGGGGPVGPLAAGVSALLVWWKRRKQR